jgi:hypothetical protein
MGTKIFDNFRRLRIFGCQIKKSLNIILSSTARGGPVKITRNFQRLFSAAKNIVLFSLAHPWLPMIRLCLVASF